MKNIMISLVAITMQVAAFADTTGTTPQSQPKGEKPMATVTTIGKTYEQKVAELKEAAEEKQRMLQYEKTMQQTMLLVETRKMQQAIENLEAMQRYEAVMNNTMQQLEKNKMEDQLEDAGAALRFEQLMQATLARAGK
ncbi:MAG: hypothetical protein MUF24_11050 [Chitinophagaceae bacterium]|nr:hypothetical protein [Chitinophagaceae bacterium]